MMDNYCDYGEILLWEQNSSLKRDVYMAKAPHIFFLSAENIELFGSTIEIASTNDLNSQKEILSSFIHSYIAKLQGNVVICDEVGINLKEFSLTTLQKLCFDENLNYCEEYLNNIQHKQIYCKNTIEKISHILRVRSNVKFYKPIESSENSDYILFHDYYRKRLESLNDNHATIKKDVTSISDFIIAIDFKSPNQTSRDDLIYPTELEMSFECYLKDEQKMRADLSKFDKEIAEQKAIISKYRYTFLFREKKRQKRLWEEKLNRTLEDRRICEGYYQDKLRRLRINVPIVQSNSKTVRAFCDIYLPFRYIVDIKKVYSILKEKEEKRIEEYKKRKEEERKKYQEQRKLETSFGEISIIPAGNRKQYFGWHLNLYYLNAVNVIINDAIVLSFDYIDKEKQRKILQSRLELFMSKEEEYRKMHNERNKESKYSTEYGNTLICDEFSIDLSQCGVEPVDVKSLKWPNCPFSTFYCGLTGAKFYCSNPNETVRKVIRIRENATLFNVKGVKNKNGHTYPFNDEIYNNYIEYGREHDGYSNIWINDFIVNLDLSDHVDNNLSWKGESVVGRALSWKFGKDLSGLDEKIYDIINTITPLYGPFHRRNRIIYPSVENYYEYKIQIFGNGVPVPKFENFSFPVHFLVEAEKTYIKNFEQHAAKLNRLQEEQKAQQKREMELKKKRQENEEKKRDFNLKNKHYRDANISLRDSHYYLQSSKLLGITRVVNNFFPQFDADYWAGIKAPLLGKSKEQLLEEWEQKRIESANTGTKLHQKIDDYYHHKTIQAEDKDFVLFKQFAEAYKLNPYRSEWAIYDEDANIVGVVDMLDYTNGNFILYDWKRSNKIVEGGQPIKENKFGEFGLRPIEKVPNTDYWHYALQLSFYRYILEKNYGINIKEARLVILHPSLNLPVVLTTPYMIDEVKKIIEVMQMNK